MSEQSDINQTVKESGYAATSGTGNATIQIYNYYSYREEVRVAPVKSVETATDEKLPSPYRGLFHFGPEDAELFFGREVFVTELVQATQTHNFIPVLGASGSGKSSVVFAGLVPELQQSGHWKFTHFRPGAVRTKERHAIVDPFYALATALVPVYEPNLNTTAQLAQASELAEYLRNGKVLLSDVVTKFQHNYPQHRLLVIADQFEELYTLCQEDKLRRDFLDKLLDSIHAPISQAKSPLVLVATMRVDFLESALSYPAFADVMSRLQIQIRSMNREELSHVIEQPAQKSGVMFEAELVNRILDDVEDEPGNLPLLEFALALLWKQRQGDQLTHTAYKAIGQVKGALTSYAEQKYGQLSSTEQEQVRHIFIQLVRPGEGTKDTRRLATKAELGEARWSLVQQLADERLVVTSRNAANQETVEVVHEALIGNWDRLRQWIEKDRLFRVWQEQLRAAMRRWEETQRDEGALQRGALLVESQDWLQKRQADLGSDEQNYIKSSLALEEREREQAERQLRLEQDRQRERAEQAERQLRLNRRDKWLLGIGLVVAVIVAAVTTVQFLQVQKANDNIFAHSLLDRAEVTRKQPNLLQFSVGLGLQAIKLSKSVELKPFLYNDLALLPPSDTIDIDNDRGSVNAVAFSKTGKYLATAGLAEKIGSDGYTCVWEETGNNKSTNDRNKPRYCVQPVEKRMKSVNAVAFSPDEKHLVTASADGKVCVWDNTNKGREIQCIDYKDKDGLEVGANAVSFSPNGNYLATAFTDGQVYVFKKTNSNSNTYNQLPIETSPPSASVIAIAFSPDSKLLAIASSDGKAYVWAANKDIKPQPLPLDHKDSVNAVAFSPQDSNYLATVSSDREIHVWNLTKKAIVYSMKHESGVVDVAFSPDGKHLATASLDGAACLWRDWKTIKTDESDKTEESECKKAAVNLTHEGSVTDVAFSPDSKYLATASSDNTARIWEVNSGYEFARLSHKDGVNALAFTEVKKQHQNYRNYLVATANLDGTARVWEINSERTIALMRHNEPVNAMALNHTTKQVATATINDKLPRMWSAANGYQKTFLCNELEKESPKSSVTALTFSKHDKYLATINTNNKFSVWELDDKKTCWKPLGQDLGDNVNSVAFSPDNIYLATASFLNNYAQLWKIPIDIGKQGKILEGYKLVGHKQSVTSVTFSKNEQYLATASRDNTARLWEVRTDKIDKQVGCVQHEAFVEAVAFSPDSKYLATASSDGKVNVSNITKITSSNQPGCQNSPSKLPQQNGPVRIVVFSPDKEKNSTDPDREKNTTYSYLVTVSGDNTAKVWKVPDKGNKPVATMKHDEPITSVAFSPDNQHLATASRDQTVRIWEITSGKLVETIPHGGTVAAVDFISLNNDNKGERLATMSGDNTARVLLWKRQELIERACTHLTMNRPTEGEWQQYVGDNEQYRKSWVCDSK